MKALPATVQPYKRTPEFNQDTIPPGLLRAHQTRDGVWGKIVVLEGRLLYTINEPTPESIELDVSRYGVVEPTVLHEVRSLGPVRFYVEFLR